MMRTIALSILILTAVCVFAGPKPLTNGDVVKLVNLGIGDPAVIAKIKQSPAVDFALDVDDLALLKKSGVSGAVLAAMLDRATTGSNPAAPAGTSGGVVEPEFVGTFFLLQDSGELQPLERQTATATMEIRAMGWGGAEGFMQVRGERSSIRVGDGKSPQFVVRVASQDADPLSLVHLLPLEPEDGNRRLSTGGASLFGGAKVGTADLELPIKATRYGRSSFLIVPAQNLAPGEYAFAGQTQGEAFCFGIDGDGTKASDVTERVIAFRPGEPVALQILERGVRIESVEVTGWPKDRHLQKAGDADRSKVSVEFTYTNRSSKDYKCKYVVAILDDAGEVLGTGEREAHVEAEEENDTNGVGVSIRTLDFPRAAKLRIQTSLRLE